MFLISSVVETKAAIASAFIQFSLYANNGFVISLFRPGLTGAIPEPNIDIGYSNEMQLKFIWLSRFFLSSQFLLADWEKSVHENIERRLRHQYSQNNWTSQSLTTEVPSFEWGSISNEDFFEKFVKVGKPVVIRNFPSTATAQWSTEYFAERYGDHLVDVINTSAVRTIPSMRLADFVSAAKTELLYLRSLSDIFDIHPELLDELGHRKVQHFLVVSNDAVFCLKLDIFSTIVFPFENAV